MATQVGSSASLSLVRQLPRLAVLQLDCLDCALATSAEPRAPTWLALDSLLPLARGFVASCLPAW